jgi:DNA polymerase-3 subunit delta
MIPRELQAELGPALGGVFYLFGAEEHGKEAAARALVAAHLDPSTGDFNYELLRGSEVSVEALSSALGTPPLMADWRVVVIRDAQGLAASARPRGMLLETAAAPPPGLALILLCTVPDASTAKFYKDLERTARSMEFAAPAANDLPDWLIDWSERSLGVRLGEKAARALAQAVGNDLPILAMELEKLASLAGDGREITLEMVAAAGTRIPRQDRWEWLDLVGRGEFMEATRGLGILLGHGESGVGLTLALTTHLLRIALALGGGRGALEAALPPRQQWLAKRYRDQARRWTLSDVERALAGLASVDRMLKSSPVTDAHWLESWLLEQASRAEAAA